MIVTLPDQFRIVTGTALEQDSGVVIDSADDGTQYSRALTPAPYYNLDVRFGALSRAEHVQLVQFFADNRQNQILLTLDGIMYRARPSAGLRVAWSHGASFADCAIRMRGVIHVE